ncbi:YrvL family regulatory protein [Anaerotignum sp. MB30-C6]|uniref:YrvL family regulatory protein n=1 Tax=Anaerotignum sp. MB30-C6 TaxID=3070814 RepID=UPI0027DE76C7|nr:YrvL family regulatory protein [Anaerotignum sp. MB30-C6]WMI81018.1 YrvL family regulatory protein [Anaerotignum sp. MB30-C6]
MWKVMKRLIVPFLGYLVIGGLILGVVSIIAMFGGVYMHLFGFQYESVGTLILFFILVSIISLPLESLAIFLTQFMIRLGLAQKNYGLVYIFFDVSSCFIAMQIVDYFMPSIVSTRLSILLFALTLSLITVYLEGKGFS